MSEEKLVEQLVYAAVLRSHRFPEVRGTNRPTLEGTGCLSQYECGRRLGISHAMVQVHEGKALAKMRAEAARLGLRFEDAWPRHQPDERPLGDGGVRRPPTAR
jgi:hypothetical protein